MTGAGRKTADDRPDEDERPRDKPANSAPDAVNNPNEKTDGKPGLPPGAEQGDETDPGGG